MLRVSSVVACLTLVAVAVAGLLACATSPTGRKQLMLLPESQVDQLGIQSFDQLKAQTPMSKDPKQTAFVQCVANAIVVAAQGKPNVPEKWEIVTFDAPTTVNAFALPGGRIGVYSGIIPVTKTDAQLGAVLGHETGHVISRHGAERMSQSVLEQGGLAVAGVATNQNPYIGAALGLGTQLGIALPFNRKQESEADEVGLNLMAEAGFDPRQAIELWKNMEAASGGKTPPELLSDHPSDPKRIEDLQKHMPEALAKYNEARAKGRAPHCAHP